MWRTTALVPLLAGLLLAAHGAAAFGQDDPFGRDFAQDDEDYFAAPPAQAEPGILTMAAAEEALGVAGPAPSEPAPIAPTRAARLDENRTPLDDLFLFVCAALVLLMQAGFAMLEAGFNSSKHTVNNLFKNVLNVAAGAVVFFLVGYHLMFPVTPAKENYIGHVAAGIDGSVLSSGSPALPLPEGGLSEQTHFFYRFALAAVAATIVSGAVAGRMKFGASVLCGAVVAGLVYPVVGYWKWGGGWLDDLGFYDFAGAGVVHMTGGFAGLAGAILLGPRIGRYTSDGKPIAIPGHSLPLATLGVFVLLVGCYGFNAGGQLGMSADGDAAAVGLIAVNTTLAACAGCCLATGLSWVLFGKPDLSMALSGLLGGLVGIAAGCNGVTNLEALAIGGVSGGAVVLATILLDKLRIDDPVGAFPVHGVCGLWGLIACAMFGEATYWGHAGGDATNPVYGNTTAQFAGAFAIAGFSFACMLGLFAVLRTVGFLRVTAEEEERGLDVSEHGMSAYAA